MSNTSIDIRLLGPVEMRVAGTPVPLGHARQRSVLAVLLLGANRPLSVPTLVARVWGEEAPTSARPSLYSYIARLREVLRHASRGTSMGPVLARAASGGYLLTLDESQLDERRFRATAESARAAGDPRTAASLFQDALELWHGVPLSGVDSGWLASVRQDLEDLYASALLDFQSVLERLGRPDELITRLQQLMRGRPLDESVARAVMRALMLSGRRAEALDQFDALRRRLRTEFGVSPDPRTVELHTEILRSTVGTSMTLSASPPPAPPRRGSPVPAQLPSEVAGFVGRLAEASELSQILSSADLTGARRVLVHGPAGVGKTALVLHTCHQIRDQFPDGQLYINLLGHRPRHAPLSPSVAMTRCLRSLGASPEEVPVELDEQTALYRSLLATRRVLVFLDDAVDDEQILPFVPGDATSALVVTSRARMSTLTADHGLRQIILQVLTEHQSLDVLRKVIGERRVADELDAATRLSRLCAGLPLALRLVAAKAADRPDDALRDLAVKFDRGDLFTNNVKGPSSVRTAFDLSYQGLPPEHRMLFRILVVLPGADFAITTAAAAAKVPIDEVEHVVHHLRAVHLIEEHVPGRYRFHDLVRLYGQQRAECEDSPRSRAATTRRVLNHYLAAVSEANAAHRLHLLQAPQVGRRAPATVGRPDDTIPTTRPGSLAWLEAEHPNILSAIHDASNMRMYEPAWRLTDALRGFSRLRPYESDWLQAARAGLFAAEATGDAVAIAALHLALADIQQARGDDALSEHHDRQALTAARTAGWTEAQAAAWSGIGRSHWSLGHLRPSREALEEALRIYSRVGYRPGEAASLGSLGRVHHDSGDWTEAERTYRLSLLISRSTGSRHGQALNIYYLGALRAEMGSVGLACRHFRAAGQLSQDSGLYQGVILTSAYLASLNALTGDVAGAQTHLQHALALAARSSDRRIAAEALNHAGDTERQLGNPAGALERYDSALSAARTVRFRRGEILALIGSARAYTADGRPREAITVGKQAADAAREGHYRMLALRAELALAEAGLRVEGNIAAAALRSAVAACRRAGLHLEAAWGARFLATIDS